MPDTKPTLERIIRFEPGYDCIRFECINGSDRCKPGEGGSHGRRGIEIRFVVKGEQGAVQFCLATNWEPEPPNCGEDRPNRNTAHLFPLLSDLGYHAREPHYEGQTPIQTECDLVGGPCYYDGSILNAREPFRILSNEGDAALWEFLEAYYRCMFGGAEFPVGKPYKRAKR